MILIIWQIPGPEVKAVCTTWRTKSRWWRKPSSWRWISGAGIQGIGGKQHIFGSRYAWRAWRLITRSRSVNAFVTVLVKDEWSPMTFFMTGSLDVSTTNDWAVFTYDNQQRPAILLCMYTTTNPDLRFLEVRLSVPPGVRRSYDSHRLERTSRKRRKQWWHLFLNVMLNWSY